MEERELNENEAVIALVERLNVPHHLFTDCNNKVVALPEGLRLHSLKRFDDEHRTAPERRLGTAVHTTLESFIAHAQRFSDRDSALFADDTPARPSLTSVLNYHAEGAEGAPRFGDHRGVYAFPLSEEWRAWTCDLSKLDQLSFATFLEDRIVDVLDPAAAGEGAKAFGTELGISLASPARLMELSRGLSVRVDTKVANHTNLSTGEAQLVFEESHSSKDGGPLKVPGGFVLAIPVFRGGELYQIPVRLRYRVMRGEGRVVWGVNLHRADRVFRDAFERACSQAQASTGLPLFFGRPEEG